MNVNKPVRQVIRIGWPRRPYIAGTSLAVSVGFLIAAMLMPIWLPSLVRRVIPDRYIVAYAPKPVQAVVFQQEDSERLLPTSDSIGSALSRGRAGTLLGNPTAGASGLVGPAAYEPTTVSDVDVAPDYSEVPASYSLSGFTHTYQGWNNCGPATLTTTLSYWGVATSQAEVAAFVKPNPEDRNVRPDELVAFAQSKGMMAIVRVNGSASLLKKLISSGFPPIIEMGFEVDKLGWMGHYVVLTAYSDDTKAFTAQDSYLGPDHRIPYTELENYWRHFNRTYLVTFDPKQALDVKAIIGSDMDDRLMWTRSLEATRQHLDVAANDSFGWFNLGTSLVALGKFDDAAVAYDQARALGLPWRMLWYQFGPYEAYLAVGRFVDVRDLADVVIADNIYSEEAYYYKGQAYALDGKIAEARAQYETATQYNKHYLIALEALAASDH